jgi:hypothetical protein
MNATNTPQQTTPEIMLAEIFCVQVPPNLPQQVRQRLFTLAARDNADKVIGHPEVIALLESIGAIVPQKSSSTSSDSLQCFGVLWAKDHAVCRRCEVNSTCHALAASYGLDTIKISPRLLGAKITRMPKMFPTVEPADTRPEMANDMPHYLVYPTSDRDLELLEWLNAMLRPVMWHGEIHYNIKGTAHYPISVGKPNGLMEVRFCSPSPDMQRILCRVKKSAAPCRPVWTLPEDATFDKAVSMINAHITKLLEHHESTT